MWHLRQVDDSLVLRLAAELSLPLAVARVAFLRVSQLLGSADPQTVRDFLNARSDLGELRRPVAVPAMERAVSRIRQAVASGERIGLYGDYDCDGVTSAAILYRYLSRGLNAKVQPRLPDRFRDGYGIHSAAVEQLANSGCTVVITCDNGVSAHAAALRAKELGVDLIVTDHHHVPANLPDAYAIVHPQVAFPEYRDLCGAGVAFLLVIALEGGLTERLESFLDLVAMGTIADMVPLSGPNRALVWAGLQQLRKAKCHPGTKALAEIAQVALDQVSTRDLGFSFGPRLNAAGRLETPDIGFQLLITNDRNEARALAAKLDQVNLDRRERNSDLEARVLSLVEAEVDVARTPFIVLGREDFHHGLVGLVAGRLAERYRTPVLLFSPNGDGTWRGSGRSPQGLHLYEALEACSEHLIAFGGHAQAAGCRVREEGLDALRDALNRHLVDIGWQRPSGDRWLDAELPFAQANAALLDALELLEPCGQQNQPPALGLLGARVVGLQIKNQRHVFMQLDDGESICEVIAWGEADRAPKAGDRVNLQYRLQWNSFRGEVKLQRIAEKDFEVLPALAPEPSRSHAFRIEDARRSGYAGDLTAEGVAVYAHHEPPGGVWLAPDEPLPGGLTTLVCLDIPSDLAT
ncbi:MAG: single-stranded-DNA-specific exonuclease RecJ, partial [Cyanobacteria bacterium REEB65]|nr:single-stranded-DNA-specific exonuclease RecJ [Cyanobacteria bacterium REEB65]